MDGVHRCQNQNQTSLTVHDYAFCYIFIFICTWAFCSGYISTKIKSFQCCSFGLMLVKLIVLPHFVALTRNGKSVTCGFLYVFM